MPDWASPRARLLASLVLAFAVSAIDTPALLPVLVLITVGAVGLAPAAWRRLRAPAVLAALFVLGLGLGTGERAFLQIGPIALYAEGLQAGAMIAARMLAIVALVWALLGRLPAHALADGLRGLCLPALMADMTMLTLRYLSDMRAELGRADLARRLRGGRDGWRALPDRATILAASLIRAQDRAERIWAAMRLRGHGVQAPIAAFNRAEWAVVALAMGFGGVLLGLDRVI